MKIALVAPPFITVPPAEYGGTELFVGHLAEGLKHAGVEVVVYTNGESTVDTERRWLYERSNWPIKSPEESWMREINHYSWAVQDAAAECDIIHVQSPQAVTFSRSVDRPFVLTLHGPHEAYLSALYSFYPEVDYVCISDAQGKQEAMLRKQTIHHGIDLSSYQLVENKQQYLSFIGRIAPIKGTHIAIDVARRSGLPLKIAGEVQPQNRDYFEKRVKPHLDGSSIEYIGPADLKAKNELLGSSLAMLFPIQWNEPFGLVMLEAMACGTPVLAMPGGSVREVVRDGVSGFVCRTASHIVKRIKNSSFQPGEIRRYVEEQFSMEKMAGRYLDLYQRILRERLQKQVA
jgi:glycosyltransferase involved in cell wall biosynthesis